MAYARHRLGLEAEAIVAEHLSAAGWRILARRHRSASGELDLVCFDPRGTLVGIEVRARRDGRSGRAIDSVDRRKVARLRTALVAYAATAGSRCTRLRIDLVTVDRTDGLWAMVRHPGIDAW